MQFTARSLIKHTVCLFALLSFFGAHMASAEKSKESEAAELAGQIHASIASIIAQAEDPSAQLDALHEKSATVALSELKRLAEDVDVLESLLINGKSLDQTLQHYRGIAYRGKNVEFFAEGIEIKESIRELARATDELMDRLDLIYK